jgi:hypothetical protein
MIKDNRAGRIAGPRTGTRGRPALGAPPNPRALRAALADGGGREGGGGGGVGTRGPGKVQPGDGGAGVEEAPPHQARRQQAPQLRPAARAAAVHRHGPAARGQAGQDPVRRRERERGAARRLGLGPRARVRAARARIGGGGGGEGGVVDAAAGEGGGVVGAPAAGELVSDVLQESLSSEAYAGFSERCVDSKG